MLGGKCIVGGDSSNPNSSQAGSEMDSSSTCTHTGKQYKNICKNTWTIVSEPLFNLKMLL